MIIIDNILEVENYIDDVKVIIFDLDDTLYNEEDYIKSGYKNIAKCFKNVNNMYNELYDAYKDGKKAIDYVFEKYGLLSMKDKALEIYRNQEPDIVIDKKVAELLDRLKETKKVGLITDGRPNGQKAKIKALGIEQYFDRIIITDELGGVEFRKPNEKAFVIMKNYFNCNYNEMVYVGDNINKDFIAPQKLGMKQIYFKNKKGLY